MRVSLQGVAVSGLVTPSVLITAGAIVLNAGTERYDELWHDRKQVEDAETQLRRLRVSLLACLVGLCSLAMSVIALTLAELLSSKNLGYVAVALVLLGATALTLGIAYAAVVSLRRPK